MIQHIFEVLVAGGLGYSIKWLFHELVRGKRGFDLFRGVVEWAGFAGLILVVAFFMLGMLLHEIDTETTDFLLPVVMGYMAFVVLLLPLTLWIVEKVWNTLSRLVSR